MTPELTPDQAEQARHLLALFDAKNSGKGQKEFDLNNPPPAAYRHQEYPCAMYDHETGAMKAAKDAKQQAAMEAEGWTREALVPEVEKPVKLSAAEAKEARAIDKAAKEAAAAENGEVAPAKRGRPKKIEPPIEE